MLRRESFTGLKVEPSRYPERLSRPWPHPYVYSSVFKRCAAFLIDFIGGLFFSPSSLSIPWGQMRRVAVLRLDHLGDVLNAFEALQHLRNAMPMAQLDLFTGPWGLAAGQMSPVVDEVFAVEAPWFARPVRKAWPFRAIVALGKRLRAGRYDMVVELRGDLRHHLALRLSGAPWRVGLAQTVGRFLLNYPAMFQAGLHEREQNLVALKAAGLPLVKTYKKIPVRVAAVASVQAQAVQSKLGLKKGFVAIQASCGTQAKRWMNERWVELIAGLEAEQVVLLGSAEEHDEMQAIARACIKKPKNAAGLLDLPALLVFLKSASMIISVDTGPGHLAAAAGLPVVSLFSGTQRKEQWAPRGPRVLVLQKAPVCSPCELTQCPFNNECMRRIEADEVLDQVATLSHRRRR